MFYKSWWRGSLNSPVWPKVFNYLALWKKWYYGEENKKNTITHEDCAILPENDVITSENYAVTPENNATASENNDTMAATNGKNLIMEGPRK